MTVSDVLAPALSSGAIELMVRLSLNLLFTAAVVRGVYYRLYRDRDYTFTYFLINLVTFSLTYLLSHVPVEMGFALGLFAVFGILRYRTEAIQVRNLTYLFVVIGIALVNALADGGFTTVVLAAINGVIAAAVAVLEAAPFSAREHTRRVCYDRLDLLPPHSHADLIADLRARTHLPVERIEIGDVDLLRDSVDIVIHYRASRSPRRHAAA